MKPAGNTLEDLIDTSPTDIIQCNEPTFISSQGETSSPHLTMVQVHLLANTTLKLLESCSGYGYKVLRVKVKQKQYRPQISSDPNLKWNLKKAI
jgi:hypothetical protein